MGGASRRVLLQAMIYREQLSLRQAVAWLGDPVTARGATRLLELAQYESAPRYFDSVRWRRPGRRVTRAREGGRRVDRIGLAALERVLADSLMVDRYRWRSSRCRAAIALLWTGAISGSRYRWFLVRRPGGVVAHRFGDALAHGQRLGILVAGRCGTCCRAALRWASTSYSTP